MSDDQKTEEKVEEAVDKAEEAAEKAEESAVVAKEASEVAQHEAQEVKVAAKEEKKEEKASPKVSKKLEELISEIEKLSVLELSELVKSLENKFGVSAAPQMVASVAPAAGAAGGDEGASEQTTFNVILADSGANKISVIKAVREIVPTLGLKEAKDLVDAAPKPVLEGANKENANEAKTKLEAAGAKVELK